MRSTDFEDFAAGEDIVLQASSEGAVEITDPASLFSAEFLRDGPDLLLVNSDGPDIRIVDYFETLHPVDLISGNGATLRGATVSRLAGPEAPGAYAQAGGAVATPIGQVETLSGAANVQRLDGKVEPLAIGVRVFRNDVVSTEDASSVSLTFVDGTIFTLAASSRMVLDELIYDETSDENTATFSLVEGTFVFIAGQVARTGGMDVETPAATMGIRGTTMQFSLGLNNGIIQLQAVLLNDFGTDISGIVQAFDLDGNLIATIDTTDSTWVFTPASDPVQVDGVQFTLTESDAIAIAQDALQLAASRAATGPLVPLGARESGGDSGESLGDQSFEDEAPSLGDDPVGPEGGGFDEDDGTQEDGNAAPQTPEPPSGPDETGGPTAPDDARLINEDDSLIGRIASESPTGGALRFDLVQAPQEGRVLLSEDGTYSYTPNENYIGDDSFVYRVTDEAGNTNQGTVSLTIAPVNDAPTAEASAAVLDEDETFEGQLIAEDVDGDDLTYSLSAPPSNGEVTIDPTTGAFSYTPDADFEGSDAFSFVVSDESETSAPVEVNLTVRAVNDAPTVPSLSFGTDEDVPLDGPGVALSAFDPDGDDVTFSIVDGPSIGTVDLDAVTGAFVYTPDANANGTDTFSYAASDGTETSLPALVTITVQPVDDVPTAEDISITLDEDTEFVGGFGSGDLAGVVSAVVVDGPGNGTIEILQTEESGAGSQVEFRYVPNENFFGSDSFSYRLVDGEGLESSLATVSVTVSPVNDAPEIGVVETPLSGVEDDFLEGQLTASDADGDDLTFQSLPVNASLPGILTLNEETGAFTFQPSPEVNGSFTAAFAVTDGTETSAPVEVGLLVGGIDDPAIPGDVELSTEEDTPVTGVLVATDVDTPASDLTFEIVTPPAFGTIVLDNDNDNAGPGFEYTPNPDAFGTEQIEYRVSDGSGVSETATLAIQVTPVNDAPTANDLAFTMQEDGLLTEGFDGSDIETDEVTYRVVDGPSQGEIITDEVPDPTGFTYRPNPDANGTDSFTYVAVDAEGLESEAATVAVTIEPVNDLPEIVSPTGSVIGTEDTPIEVTVLAEDADGDDVTFVLVSGPVTDGEAAGDIEFDETSGVFTYTPPADYVGSASFEVAAADGEGQGAPRTITIDIGGENDVPIITGPEEVAGDEDTTLSGQIIASDPDGEPVTFNVITAPSSDATDDLVFDTETGTFSFTPQPDFNGGATLVVEAVDAANATSGPFTVDLVVEPVNDAPTAADVTETTEEDTPVEGVLPGDDIDTPAETLTYEIVDGPAFGELVLSGTGPGYTYTPDEDQTGQETITYRVSDGELFSELGTLTIDVDPVNDAPTAEDVTLTTDEDTSVPVEISASDSETAAEDLTVTFGASTLGSFAPDEEGPGFTFTPNSDASGTEEVTYTVSDGELTSNEATIFLTVEPVNDAPTVSDVTPTVAEDTVDAPIALVASDAEDGTATIRIKTGPSNGTLVAGATAGTFLYTPELNFNGTDSFTYEAVDSEGVVSDSVATATITVTPQNDAPIVENVFLQTTAGNGETDGALVTGTIPFIEPDGDSVTFALVGGQPAGGNVVVNPNSSQFSFTPNATFIGVETFQISVSDNIAPPAISNVSVAVGSSSFDSGDGPAVSLVIDADAIGDTTLPRGNVAITTESPTTQNVNLIFVVDQSGSISNQDWRDTIDAISTSVTNLQDKFRDSATNVDVQVIYYSNNAFALNSGSFYNLQPVDQAGVADFDTLIADLTALRADLPGGGTNFENAFQQVLSQLATTRDGETAPRSSETSFMYFLTDGVATSGDESDELSQLQSISTLTIEAFGIGSGVNSTVLDNIDSNSATLLNEPSQLEAAFAASPLFAANLVSVSVQLSADGGTAVTLADSVDAFQQVGIDGFALNIGAIDGIADVLGEQNVLQATATFDIDGPLLNGDPVTIFQTGTIGISGGSSSKTGTSEADVLFGSTEADTLSGLAGDDVLIGGGGGDLLVAGEGVDTLFGGDGDDRLEAGTAVTGERFEGGEGRDSLSLDNGDLLPSLALASIEEIDLENGAADNVLLTLADVLALSDTGDADLAAAIDRYVPESVSILGDAGDQVDLVDAVPTPVQEDVNVNGTAFDIYEYQNGAGEVLATLAIDADVTVVAVTTA